MNVGSLCKRAIVSIDGGCTLRQAAQAMLSHHVGAIVVTAMCEGRQDAVGLVTDRDLAIACVAHELDPSEVFVGAISSRPLVSVLSSSSAAQAADILQSAGVRRLLVCDNHGQIVGLLSSDDLLGALIEPLRSLVGTFHAGIEREEAWLGAPMPPTPQQLFLPS
jgi:CBS domain-containing protein